MKNVRAIYQKLREVKYYHLVEIYKQYSKRIPTNCKYNYQYVIGDNETRNGCPDCGAPIRIGLCLLHQPNLDLKTKVIPHLVDVCQEPRHCINCNGFIARYGKEDIKKIFEEELKNMTIKRIKYPDICALEWVLEQSIVGPPPFNWIQKIYYVAKKRLSDRKIL
jgi:hypothetical protein